MRRFLVRFSESEASNHTPSLADFTTTTPELIVHTPGSHAAWYCVRRQPRANSLPDHAADFFLSAILTNFRTELARSRQTMFTETIRHFLTSFAVEAKLKWREVRSGFLDRGRDAHCWAPTGSREAVARLPNRSPCFARGFAAALGPGGPIERPVMPPAGRGLRIEPLA